MPWIQISEAVKLYNSRPLPGGRVLSVNDRSMARLCRQAAARVEARAEAEDRGRTPPPRMFSCFQEESGRRIWKIDADTFAQWLETGRRGPGRPRLESVGG